MKGEEGTAKEAELEEPDGKEGRPNATMGRVKAEDGLAEENRQSPISDVDDGEEELTRAAGTAIPGSRSHTTSTITLFCPPSQVLGLNPVLPESSPHLALGGPVRHVPPSEDI